METITITTKKSARLLQVEINLAGEKFETMLNQGPNELENIEKLVHRLLFKKGFHDYTVLEITALSEGLYQCAVGKIAS